MMREEIIVLLESFKSGLLACATNGAFNLQEYQKMRSQILDIEYLKTDIPVFIKVHRSPEEFRRYMQGQYGDYASRRRYITEEINKLILCVENRKDIIEVENENNIVLGERLGHGGFGQVYKYHHELLELDFAIKVLDPIFVDNEEQATSERRFFREAKMLFELQHPNIIQIYNVGKLEGKSFIQMELIDGYDMNGLSKEYSNISFSNSLRPIIELLKGLEYAHNKGIIHRDLKPSNYMYSKKSGYKIIDFGISTFLEIEGQTKLTKTGEQVAGGMYTDPQLLENPKLRDCRSDIYSVGAIWYFLLTGRAPSGADMLKRLIDSTNISEEEASLVMKCLAYELEDRYSNCLALRKILEKLRNEKTKLQLT